MTIQEMLATVDLGSNSFRLQICLNQNGQLKIIDSIKEMVRMAAGLDEQKNLDKNTQERALACLARFGQRLRDFKPTQVRVVATNTFRVAKNINFFIPLAEAALGFPIEIIAGREEARLIYTGVVHTLPPNGQKMLVVDIGGGSTEFIIGNQLQPDITESLNLGCVTYSMRFFPKGKINQKNFQNAINAAMAEIQRISPALIKKGWDHAIGTSGSARSIRDIIELNNEADGFITYDGMKDIANQLIKAGNINKAHLNGLRSDRLDVFTGGLAVMMGVFKELNIKSMKVTDAALRDGVFYDMIGRKLGHDLRNQTIVDFQNRYHIDKSQAKRVAFISDIALLDLVDSTENMHELTLWRQYIAWAAALHEIGLTISHTGYHKHSAYIIEQADMPGFSRKEQHILSILVLGHRGDLRKLADYMNNPMLWLSMLSLRLGALFCRARQKIDLPKVAKLNYDTKHKQCILAINKTWFDDNPLTASALKQESLLWRKMNMKLSIQMVSV